MGKNWAITYSQDRKRLATEHILSKKELLKTFSRGEVRVTLSRLQQRMGKQHSSNGHAYKKRAASRRKSKLVLL